MEKEVLIKIGAEDQASSVFDSISEKVSQSMAKMEADVTKSFQVVGGVITGFGAAVAAGLGASVVAAGANEEATVRLKNVVENAGLSWNEYSGIIEDHMKVVSRKTGISDEEQMQSLTLLIAQTGNVTEALKLNTLAVDIAAGTGRDYNSLTRIMMLSEDGRYAGLKRLGVAISDFKIREKELKEEVEAGIYTSLESVDMSKIEVDSKGKLTSASNAYVGQLIKEKLAKEAMAEVQKKYAGAADKMSETFATQMKIAGNEVDELAETVGGVLLPNVILALKEINKLAQGIGDFAKHHPVITQVAVAIAAIAAAVALVVGPILLFIGMIPAIAGGFAAIGTVFAAIGVSMTGMSGAIAVVMGLIGSAVAAVLPLILAFAAAIAAVVFLGFQIYELVKVIIEQWDNWGVVIMNLVNIIRLNLIMAFNQARDGIMNAWKGIVGFVEGVVNGILSNINRVIEGINKLLNVNIPTFKEANWSGSSGGTGSGNNSPLPTKHGGGIVPGPLGASVPIMALGGERFAGPSGGSGGNSVVVNVGNYMGDEISKRTLVRDIQNILNEEDRRRQYRPTETKYYSPGGHL